MQCIKLNFGIPQEKHFCLPDLLLTLKTFLFKKKKNQNTNKQEIKKKKKKKNNTNNKFNNETQYSLKQIEQVIHS